MSTALQLDPQAVITRAVPRFEIRPQQLAMARAVAKAFEKPEHLLVEAGTGVGKSFAYLVPAIERVLNFHQKIVVATHTIALQEQIVKKDIPALARAIDQKFKAVLVKGRQNYFSIRRLTQTSRRQQALFATAAERNQLHRIEQWAYRTKDGSLSDLGLIPLPQVWSRIRSESNNCMGTRCDYYDKCFYYRARRRIWDADILVVNHALYFADLALRRRNVSVLPDHDYVIFDEAHNIEAVASDHFGLALSSAGVAHLLGAIFNERTGRGFIGMLDCPAAVQKAVEAHRKADVLFAELAAYLDGRAGTVRLRKPLPVNNLLSPVLRELAGQLAPLAKTFEREDDRFELSSLIDRCTETAANLEALLRQQLDNYVYWMERGGGREKAVSLCAAPLRVDQILREQLFERVRAVILTSATLSIGGPQGFAYLRSRLGVPHGAELRLDSPFDYPRQATLHIHADLPEPTDGQFVADACERIKRYLLQTEGGAFVLFTSYDALNRAAEKLRPFCDANGLTLLVQGRGRPTGQLVSEFKKAARPVILGTDSFWQGVDIPGSRLRNVIITKLPFAAPDRPLLEARIEALRAGGQDPFMELQLPEAVLKLKQGFGRLIRTKSDRGIVVILDKRVKTKAYGRRFLEALPPCRLEFH